MIQLVKLPKQQDYYFWLGMLKDDKIIGTIIVAKDEPFIPYVHIEVIPSMRGKWLTRSIKNQILRYLHYYCKYYNIDILNSSALAQISPRLLLFFGFKKYLNEEILYYLKIKR